MPTCSLKIQTATISTASTASGTDNEVIAETLLAGTYYVRVESQETGVNKYVFRYGVSAPDPGRGGHPAGAARRPRDCPGTRPLRNLPRIYLRTRVDTGGEQDTPETVPEPEAEETSTDTSTDEDDTDGEQDTPQTVSEPEGDDFPADTSTDGWVVVGTTATGEIGSEYDRDWFGVKLEAGATYTVDILRKRREDGKLVDPYLSGHPRYRGQPYCGYDDRRRW